MYRNFTIQLRMELKTTVMLSKQDTRKLLLVFAWSLSGVATTRKLAVQNTEKVNNSTYITKFILWSTINKDIYAEQKFEYVERARKYHLDISVNTTNGVLPVAVTQIAVTHINDDPPTHWEMNYKQIRNGLKDVRSNMSAEVVSYLICTNGLVDIDITDDIDVTFNSLKCLRQNQIRQTRDEYGTIKTVITFVGMGFSVIALTVCIILYRLSGLHDSVSGSNTENLSFALLLANVLFLVGAGANDYWFVCYAVGVCLHYLWLTVFSFMTVSMVHISNTFRKMSSQPNASQKQPDRRLTILGLVLPTPFIISALTLDLLKVSDFASNYDGRICFPTGYPASLLFMSGPMGVSITVNIFCFVCTAFMITRQAQSAKIVRKSNSYQFLSVYARISVVTGVFWISGLFVLFFQTEVVEFIFIILCSSQGFFVALANLTTKRAMGIIRNWMKRMKRTTKNMQTDD